MVRSGMGAFMFPSNLAPLQRREVSASWERGDEDFREIESSGMKVFFSGSASASREYSVSDTAILRTL